MNDPIMTGTADDHPFNRTLTNRANFAKGSMGTGIQWCTHTWNPFVGCSKVSDGCRDCYAIGKAAQEARFGITHYVGLTKKLESGRATWAGNVVLAPEHIITKPLSMAPGSIVFVNSMSDFFHENATDEMRLRALDIIRQRPDIIFQILTKRPEDISAFLSRTGSTLPSNVWLGVTVESSKYLARVALLRAAEANVRFLSIEPLLDDIAASNLDLRGIDWVIIGGESGRKTARPMDVAWVRRLRRSCAAEGVAVFFKQWGRWTNNPLARDADGRLHKMAAVYALDPHGKGGALLDGELVREMPAAYWEHVTNAAQPRATKRRLPVAISS